jgi:hypothetical protein
MLLAPFREAHKLNLGTAHQALNGVEWSSHPVAMQLKRADHRSEGMINE